jgi:alpha-N-arabinofuranosidase
MAKTFRNPIIPGYLRLKLRPEKLSEWANPSFVGRRQKHIHFAARTAIEFAPQAKNECAGMVLLQNSDYHYRLVITLGDNGAVVRLVQRRGKESPHLTRFERPPAEETVLAERPIDVGRVYLKVEAHGQAYSFHAATCPEAWQPVAENVDGRILSTPVAGGFVGAYIGMYASSNGQTSEAVADFDWFEYAEVQA